VRAVPLTQAAQALLAEVAVRAGDRAEAEKLLGKAADAAPDGVAGALVLRTKALLGYEGAEAELRAAVRALGAPGLLIGMAAGDPSALK
jgi:hypothetical protein